jgi:NADPH-dependent curcumin reductase CurA
MTENRKFLLKSRPVGNAKRSDFDFVTAPVAEPGPGEVRVKTEYLSLDPAMRGWMNEARSYVPPVALGDVMRALGVGRVEASNDPALAVGDWVTGTLGMQAYAVGKAKTFNKIDVQLAPAPRWLSLFGIAGLTAYFGLFDVGQPKAGETVVVSGAAGSVGVIVGQLAKIHGCRVVGIAGGADKCRYLGELGFDAAIDYKHEDVLARLRATCPKGIDVFFDNVGGDMLDAALATVARHARVVICGAISQYNATGPTKGPSNYLSLLVHHARMEGFTLLDYQTRFPEGVMKLAGWAAQGQLRVREDIVEGLEKFPDALDMLFAGKNFGKLILKV